MLPKAKRLTVQDVEALSYGTSVFGTLVSLRMIKADESKFGVAVSKKIAKTAVMRNRIRRRVYSLLRNPDFMMVRAHVLLMPKKEFFDSDVEVLKQALLGLFKKARLI